jgi:lysophospholipase L1-like esterase
MIVIGDEMKSIVFFGDSVTEAHRNMKDTNDLGQGFIYLLEKTYPQFHFFNRGIGGQKVLDLLKRVHHDVIDLRPDVCFIWIGINDAWLPYLLHQSPTKDSFVDHYQLLIHCIQDSLKEVKLILIKPFALPIGHVSIDVYRDLELFRDFVEHIGDINKLDVIDIKKDIEAQLVLMSGDALFYDGIHPTPKGYEIIKDVIDRYIKEHIL